MTGATFRTCTQRPNRKSHEKPKTPRRLACECALIIIAPINKRLCNTTKDFVTDRHGEEEKEEKIDRTGSAALPEEGAGRRGKGKNYNSTYARAVRMIQWLDCVCFFSVAFLLFFQG
ncbi:hypothetical protein Zmor_017208 [Zophobas morio]|uniref:Uncharacterized protein n=1 Tax=Zophobas morio TaxID=2755281 RepID=A0AA38I8E8_9CUCU|nr:hypothetical protein Zmor_017208 [Zophobas morio]